MAKGDATRRMIVDEALAFATRSGLEALSIGALAYAVKLSKSGLFAHFKSKDALQAAVLREALERFEVLVMRPASREAPGRARLDALMSSHLDWIEGQGNLAGCPFVTMAQEYDDRPGPLRDALVAAQNAWRRLLGETVREAVARRELPQGAEPDQVVFELIGTALAFQQAHKLLDDPSARSRAEASLARLLAFAPQHRT